MTSSLWDRFTTYDNFLLAWQRTVNCSSRIIHDQLGIKIFAYNLDTNLRDLLGKVQAEDYPYTPMADHKVYVPKPSTTLRTMSLMSVSDLIVFQALINVIADTSHQLLVTHENQHVLGNLYAGPGKRWMLRPWKKQYNWFVERIETIFNAGNPWIASTDIVAFYDTIDHERLVNLVSKYCGKDQKFETLLRACLKTWSAHTSGVAMSRGIPQGSNASDFLANLYLSDIDREMIVHGYQYVRYVDDVRILGAEKSIVQRGLILFDMELKKAGLVAQVSKTSVHKIDDIEKEISRLRFFITDVDGTGDYILAEIASPPKSEQAESISEFVQKTQTDLTEIQADKPDQDNSGIGDDFDNDPAVSASNKPDIDQHNSSLLQQQLRERFLKAYSELEDPEKSKPADSAVTFCLYRLDPHESIREQVLALLHRIPWRSEAVTKCLARFVNDGEVIKGLHTFIKDHDVYTWHKANALWALYQVAGPKYLEAICKSWLADSQLDWYARLVAAKILAEVPTQHAFLVECLRREQANQIQVAPEETAILRQEFAYGAFQRIKSPSKQLTLFKMMCLDPSPSLKRLSIYLLQQPECRVTWEHLVDVHQEMAGFADLVIATGVSADAPKLCFIAQTLVKEYNVTLTSMDLRSLYAAHYQACIRELRGSVSAYHQSPDEYIRFVHRFGDLTLRAFYATMLPNEKGLDEYHSLTDRKTFSEKCPKGLDSWKKLGLLRNRVDHPVDRKTQMHSKHITVKEADDMRKELQVAFQELFDVWLNSAPPVVGTPTSTTVTSP